MGAWGAGPKRQQAPENSGKFEYQMDGWVPVVPVVPVLPLAMKNKREKEGVREEVEVGEKG